MEDLFKKELIGLSVEISDSRNKSNIGIKGKVIDETKNCLVIKTEKGEKRVMKENIMITIPEKKVRISGKIILGKPEERIKKRLR